jgi:nucleoside-diphosphate-sugar epimerase
MRVFVAGASGVIGKSLLPQLAARGHEVVGMTRSEQKTQLIRDLGAEPMMADAFDAERLRQVVSEARPEVVIHQLTDIPRSVDPKQFAEQFARNNQLRREGTRNLVAAAQAAGARRVIAQSIAFVYRYGGGVLHSEEDPLAVEMGDVVAAVGDLEAAVTGAEGIEGIVLRYGYFYGPGTSYASDGSQAEMVRKRRLPIVGNGDAVFSFIHVDDAAAATVRAIDHASPGAYNVVDDEPAPVREWLPVYAQSLGAKPPRRIPLFLARWLGGEYGVRMMTRTEGASNRKAKDELGMQLRYPSWRRGFAEALG